MSKITRLTVIAGVLVSATSSAMAQMDRNGQPNDRAPYDRPADRPADRDYNRPADRPSDYDRPSDRGDRPLGGTYEGMRTGPQESHQGSVTFITGGVTKDEAQAFRAVMPRYALSLEFARANAPRGDFLANVDVSVTDARGQPVLQTVADGPFLAANLPVGQYTVRAASEGRVKTQTVSVAPGQNRHLTFTW